MNSTPEKEFAPTYSHDVETTRDSSIDPDALKLAEMGYTQDLNRNFSVWSVLGVGFSLTNSWFGISAALITGINSGGPLLIIYGSTCYSRSKKVSYSD
jgi:choline transport protein